MNEEARGKAHPKADLDGNSIFHPHGRGGLDKVLPNSRSRKPFLTVAVYCELLQYLP